VEQLAVCLYALLMRPQKRACNGQRRYISYADEEGPMAESPTTDAQQETPVEVVLLPVLGACGCGSGCGCGCQSGAPCQCGGCCG
jgi:hypothetical protein